MPRLRPAKIVSLTTADGGRHQVVQERWPATSYGEQFVIFFTAALKRAALALNGGITFRVLLLLPDYLNFTDFQRIRTAELAEEARTHPGNVSRALAALLKQGIVEREGRGTATAWRLSAHFGWQGNADQWHAHHAGRLKGKKPPAPRAANTDLPDTPPAQRQARLRLLAAREAAD